MFAKLAVVFAAVAAVSAAPASLQARDVGPQCAGLGPGAFDVASNFTLSAYNSDVTKNNDTGVPLVLGQAGAVDGAEFKVFSTYASFPYNQWPSLSLINGALYANGSNTNDAAAGAPSAGGEVTFIVPPQGPADPVWCGVADTDPAHGGYPQLALNGDTDSFSLCPTQTTVGAQVNVVYKATLNNYGQYIYAQCYPVKLYMLEQY